MGKDVEPLHQVLHSQRSPDPRNHEKVVLASPTRIKVHVSQGVSFSTPDCLVEMTADCPTPSRKPLTAYLFYSGNEASLAKESDLIMDIPGGGFICMNPEHHAERLLRWAKQTGRPVLSFDYGKASRSFDPPTRARPSHHHPASQQAPEYPYPFAIDEMYDAYSLLHSTKGKCIGMNLDGSRELRILLTGDSASVPLPSYAYPRLNCMRA